MITENYVSFETAKLLKEKGFECATLHYYYDKDGDLLFSAWRVDASKNEFGAPTLQMVMKWLREVHKIHISVMIGFDVDNPQYYFFNPSVSRFSNKSGEYETPFGEKEFNTYEEAAEAAIKYCVENLT